GHHCCCAPAPIGARRCRATSRYPISRAICSCAGWICSARPPTSSTNLPSSSRPTSSPTAWRAACGTDTSSATIPTRPPWSSTMPELKQIQEPGAAPRAKPSMSAFLGLGFRPIYMAGAAWALISIALWIFAPQWLGAPLSGVYWHAHEMLWGFIITIAVGFLLTASATWTGVNPLHGWPLGVLCVLWVIARLGFLFGGLDGFRIACVAEAAFFL